MPTPAPQAAALAAKGHPVTLADGTTVQLRYTMAGLLELEADFGNVARIMTEITAAAAALEASFAVAEGRATDAEKELDTSYAGSSVFAILVRALRPGLLDAEAIDPRSGEAVYVGEQDERTVARLLDPSRLQEYLTAFGRSFNEAFYAGDAPTAGGGVSTPRGTPGRGRGGSGGTSPARSGAGPKKRSGA